MQTALVFRFNFSHHFPRAQKDRVLHKDSQIEDMDQMLAEKVDIVLQHLKRLIAMSYSGVSKGEPGDPVHPPPLPSPPLDFFFYKSEVY